MSEETKKAEQTQTDALNEQELDGIAGGVTAPPYLLNSQSITSSPAPSGLTSTVSKRAIKQGGVSN